MNELELKIHGMTCDGCVRSVRNALSKLQGVEVDDVAVGSARVRFDTAQVAATAIAAAVERAGFDVARADERPA
jgi:copper chaperone